MAEHMTPGHQVMTAGMMSEKEKKRAIVRKRRKWLAQRRPKQKSKKRY